MKTFSKLCLLVKLCIPVIHYSFCNWIVALVLRILQGAIFFSDSKYANFTSGCDVLKNDTFVILEGVTES
jgi:hypothetical protein